MIMPGASSSCWSDGLSEDTSEPIDIDKGRTSASSCVPGGGETDCSRETGLDCMGAGSVRLGWMLSTRSGGRGVGSLDVSGYSIDVGVGVGVGVEVKFTAKGLACCAAPSTLGAYRNKSRLRKVLLPFGGAELVCGVVVVVAKKSVVSDRGAAGDLFEFGLLPFPFTSRSSVVLFVGRVGLDGRVEKGEAKKAWVLDWDPLDVGEMEEEEGDIEGEGTDDSDNGSRSV